MAWPLLLLQFAALLCCVVACVAQPAVAWLLLLQFPALWCCVVACVAQPAAAIASVAVHKSQALQPRPQFVLALFMGECALVGSVLMSSMGHCGALCSGQSWLCCWFGQ